jgi:hypothetical protein
MNPAATENSVVVQIPGVPFPRTRPIHREVARLLI